MFYSIFIILINVLSYNVSSLVNGIDHQLQYYCYYFLQINLLFFPKCNLARNRFLQTTVFADVPKGHTILGVIRKEGPDPTEILFLNSVKSQCPNGKGPGLGLFSFVAIYFWEGHFVSKALFLLLENGDSYTSFIYCIGCFFVNQHQINL